MSSYPSRVRSGSSRAHKRSRKLTVTVFIAFVPVRPSAANKKRAPRPTEKQKAPRGAFGHILFSGAPRSLVGSAARDQPPVPTRPQPAGGRAFYRNRGAQGTARQRAPGFGPRSSPVLPPRH